jgi:hypothetical protein
MTKQQTRRSGLGDRESEYLRRHIQEFLLKDSLMEDAGYPLSAAGTISDYLAFREKWPSHDFRMYPLVFDEYEWIQNIDDAVDLGISERSFFRALRGDVDSMDEICLVLLRQVLKFEEETDKSHAVRRQKKISDAKINHLVASMQEACLLNGVVPPGSLGYLTSLRLCGRYPKGKQKSDFWRFAQRVMIAIYGEDAIFHEYPESAESGLTLSEVARRVGVAASTIARYQKEIIRTVERMHLADQPPEEWLDPPIETGRQRIL